ncbi:MAG: RAMP superfamily CRISPR-associated protein [Bacillota bacterium]
MKDQQKTYYDPHNYFFVRLPGSVYRRKLQRPELQSSEELIPLHGQPWQKGLLSGVLFCCLTCITPVHVGSGSYRKVSGKVAVDIIRDSEDNPVIPGSSLKGSFRAIAEAVSKSCLTFRGDRDSYEEKLEKLPWETGFRKRPSPENSYWRKEIKEKLSSLQSARVKSISVEPCIKSEFSRCTVNSEQPGEIFLCPCCSIFGALGYRGRVAFTEARVTNSKTVVVVNIPARHSPQPHRLADKATWAGDPADRSKAGGFKIKGEGENLCLTVLNPLGRKFYPYQKPTFNTGEPHCCIPENATLKFSLYFESLFPWELGLLLFSLGAENQVLPLETGVWLPKVGGGKAYGLGSVRVGCEELRLVPVSDLCAQPRSYIGEALEEKVRHYLEEFCCHPAFHKQGADDLRVGLSEDLEKHKRSGRLHTADNARPFSGGLWDART